MSRPSRTAAIRRSLSASAGTIVFGMEEGTVSIFGLVFGVAATTSSSAAIIIAGASGAAAASVSMMAGAYLEAETSRDKRRESLTQYREDYLRNPAMLRSSLLSRRDAAGLSARSSKQILDGIVQYPDDFEKLLTFLRTPSSAATAPKVQATWMLLADFFSAVIPILPFVFLPVAIARIVSAIITLTLLVLLGLGRARMSGKSVTKTIVETFAFGVVAAFAGVAIGMFIQRFYN